MLDLRLSNFPVRIDSFRLNIDGEEMAVSLIKGAEGNHTVFCPNFNTPSFKLELHFKDPFKPTEEELSLFAMAYPSPTGKKLACIARELSLALAVKRS